MAKFNTKTTRPGVSSPVTSEKTASGVTHEGGDGYARDAKSELFLLAVANMVGEQTFYEGSRERDTRFENLVHAVAVEDLDWLARFLPWLRNEANMRTAPIVGALEAAGACLDKGLPGSRQLIASVLQRPDEPGEALAYWTSRYGRAIPKPIKRGVADAVARLYDERALLRYDTDSKGFRFGDVIDLVHPSPKADWQGDLFEHALDRRHGRDKAVPESLAMVRARAELMAVPVERRRELLDSGALQAAGMSWESLAGWLQGPMDAEAWQAVIPSMGYMALLRNLRNFDEAGVPDVVAADIAAKLADPERVARSRQLPMRFLSAYRVAGLRWSYALEKALQASLANVPELPGHTLILVDQSGSMGSRLSARSDLSSADAAAVFGAALALRSADANLVQFDNRSQAVPVSRGDAILRVVERFWGARGGTDTADAVRSHYRNHDRVVIVTDEQVMGGWPYRSDPTKEVPPNVPMYTWNLVGYRHGHGPSGSANRHTFGGLTDQAFRMIPLLEAGKNADWPF